MIKKVKTIEKLDAEPYLFKRHEFIISDDKRVKVESEIRNLTNNFSLSDIRSKGKMVKLTLDEVKEFL